MENIERKLEIAEEGTARHKVLSSAKSFKTSWFDLGQSLYSVWRDRLYKDWGYATFDAYTAKEIGIKKPTAMKLLKSYYFLEKEEPNYVERAAVSPENPARTPTYDAINLLRLAKNKKTLDGGDYAHLRREVLEMGREAGLVKKDLTSLMKQREELLPDEARHKKKVAVLKRLITSLKALRTDIENSKLLPAAMVKEISGLIHKIELEIT
jgi:hypothetical protein